MKRWLLLVSLVVPALLVCGPLSAAAVAATLAGDGGWVLQDSPTTSALTAVCAPDALHAWAVGAGGTIVATTTGGASWHAQDGGTQADLNGVAFVDARHGWAVGGRYDDGLGTWVSTILVTSDGGDHWQQQYSGTNEGLAGVSFVDATHGWAVGGTVYPADPSSGFWGTVLATSDGGEHWKRQTLPTGMDLHGVSFIDRTHGWLVGDGGTVCVTSDGGGHWTTQRSFTSFGILAVSCVDRSHCWAVGVMDGGQASAIGARTDGRWKRQFVSSQWWFGDIVFADALHGWAVGSEGHGADAGAGILATTDGGAHWHQQHPGTPAEIMAIAATGPRRAWTVDSAGGILATVTGGTSPVKVALSGAVDDHWYHRGLTIGMACSTSAAGASIASASYSLDGGAAQPLAGTSCSIDVPPVDGTHTISYVAADTTGASCSDVFTVNIDTHKPSTRAPAAVTAPRGKTAPLTYEVIDPSPCGGTAKVTIRIEDRAGAIVRTLRCTAKRMNVVLPATFTVPRTWKTGSYRFFVSAVDTAGNRQANVASNRLVVK